MKAAIPILLSGLAAGADLASQDFRVNINDKTGAIDEITDPRFKNAMNWVSTGSNAPWLPTGSRWGLGYADLGQDSLHRNFWNFPQITKRDNIVEAVYTAGSLELLVSRSVDDKDQSFTESYTFTNKGAAALDLDSRGTTSLAIYTPFNDHYTNTSDCVAARSHAHIWAFGGASSWVKLNQMGGKYRNLGLVLTKGALVGYSIEGRDPVTLSNTRGVFLLHPSIPTLQPGESSTIAWTWFWHTDWDDFFEQSANRSEQFVRIETDDYTSVTRETSSISLSGASINANTKVSGQAVQCDDQVCNYNFTAGRPGRTNLVVTTDNGYNSTIFLNTVPKYDDLIDSRTKFIIENQQDLTPNTPAEGAYRVFDNQANLIATWDTSTDRNPGHERVGMGILMARWLKKNPENVEVRESLEKYYTYVSTKLQEENGFVRDRPIGMDGSKKRLYNWPWVLQFHITVAALDLNLTGTVAEKTPLERFMLTLENFYAEGGGELYAIGLPILESLRALEKHGNEEWLKRAKELFLAHGENIATRGLDYPSFEVNFEQSIVAPAAVMLLELWRYTNDDKWLEAGKLHLDTLLLFAGKQPDFRLHDVAIRHWDGYWFGKDRMWGDTFPHYWSTLNGIALHHYGKGLKNDTEGQAAALKTAGGIIRNNLALFEANGRASCAYIYPTSVNGRAGNYKDPYANDQDWVLAHLLQIEEDDAFDGELGFQTRKLQYRDRRLDQYCHLRMTLKRVTSIFQLPQQHLRIPLKMIYLSYELLDAILTYLPTRKKWLLRRTCKAFNDVLLQQLFKMLRKLQRACKTLPGNVKFLPHEMEHFYNFLLQAGLYEGLPRVTESHIYEWGDKYQYPHEPYDHLPFTLTQASKMHNPLYASVCGLMMLFLYDMHREEGVMGVCGTWAVYCSYCISRRSAVRDCPDGFRGCGAIMSLNRNMARCAYWYTARMFRSVRMWEYQSYLEEAFGVYEAIEDIERRCEHFDAVRRRDYQEASIGGVWKPPRWP